MSHSTNPLAGPPRKSSGSSSNTLIIAVVFIVALLIFLSSINSPDDATNEPSRPQATPAPLTADIVYSVSGTTKSADLTYRNESEGTEQRDVSVPWTLRFKAPIGQFLYLSAQSTFDGSATIVCKITVDGIVLQEAESSGEYKIAQCSGSVGD